MSVVDRFISRVARRPADFTIGGDGDPYLRRWYVIPRNRFFNVYLHEFVRSDDDRALHDHPWWNCSVVLRGMYLEHLQDGRIVARREGRVVFRRPATAHRVELIESSLADGSMRHVWSLFLTGPRIREWGFHCPQGWVPWQKFVALTADGNAVGKGCDQ